MQPSQIAFQMTKGTYRENDRIENCNSVHVLKTFSTLSSMLDLFMWLKEDMAFLQCQCQYTCKPVYLAA